MLTYSEEVTSVADLPPDAAVITRNLSFLGCNNTSTSCSPIGPINPTFGRTT